MRMKLLCLTDQDADALRAALPNESEQRRALRRLGAFPDRNRLRVALVLSATDELCVGDTAKLLGVPGKLVSRHMRVLAERGPATKERAGKLIRYRLTGEARTHLEATLVRPLPVQVAVGDARTGVVS